MGGPKRACRARCAECRKSVTSTRTHFFTTFSLLGATREEEIYGRNHCSRPSQRHLRGHADVAAGFRDPKLGQRHRVLGDSLSVDGPVRHHSSSGAIARDLHLLGSHRIRDSNGEYARSAATFTMPTCPKAIDEVTWRFGSACVKKTYCSRAYSTLACLKMGMSGRRLAKGR